MHIFIEDDDFKRIDIVDNYKSLVWAERYDEIGDFRLIVPDTKKNLQKIQLGSYLAIPKSTRRMVVLNSDQKDGLIEFSGYSIEHILKTRLVKPGTTWDGTTATIAAMMFNLAFVQYQEKRSFSADDVIPNSVYRYENIPNDSTSYTTELETVYSGVKKVCGLLDLGFRIDCEFVNGAPRLAFVVYGGHERKDVVFDPRVGTLDDLRILRSMSLMANNAIVKYRSGDSTAFGFYSRGIAFKGDRNLSIPKQFKRSVVYTDASDIERDLADQNVYWRALRTRANSAMTDNTYIRSITGRSPAKTPYEYGVDYKLGDIVKVSTGQENATARVSEFIWSVSNNELTGYPTFRFN